MRAIACVLAVVSIVPASAYRAHERIDWKQLEPGLERASIPIQSDAAGAVVEVVRADPAKFRMRLYNASAPGEGKPRTAREWSARHDLALAVNASMYQEDHLTSVSLMRTGSHVNNRRVSKDRTVLAFDRKDSKLPEVQIIDRDCQDFDSLSKRYGSLVQSIRMVSCKGKNVWAKESRRTSIACMGVDTRGRMLFFYSGAPLTPYDLIQTLLAAPLKLKGAMYLEGGPEAQLYVRSGEREVELTGGGDLGLLPEARRPAAWRIPNVLGLERRKRTR